MLLQNLFSNSKVNLILFCFLCFTTATATCDSSLDNAIEAAENLLLEDCKTIVDTIDVLTPQKKIDTIICKLRIFEADKSSFDYCNLVFTAVAMLCMYNIGMMYQKEDYISASDVIVSESVGEITTDNGPDCSKDEEVAVVTSEIVVTTSELEECEKQISTEVNVTNKQDCKESEETKKQDDKDISDDSPVLAKTVSFASDKPSEKSDDDNDVTLKQTKEVVIDCDDEKVCDQLEKSDFFQDLESETKHGEQTNWVTVTRSRKSPRPQTLDLKREVIDVEPSPLLSTSHSSKSVGECTPPISPQMDVTPTKLTSLELTEEELQPGSTPHEFDLEINEEVMESILNKMEVVETATTEGADENEQLQTEEEDKTNELKPMIFVGGISASTSPMELVTALKAQGFKVVVVPRIRYGVSFGFCPDLVLSTEEEVQTLLAKGRVWVKDRWVDIRPYVPKDSSTNPVPIAAPDSKLLDGVTTTPHFVPCTPSTQFTSMPFFHPVPSLGNYSSGGYIHPTAGYQPFYQSMETFSPTTLTHANLDQYYSPVNQSTSTTPPQSVAPAQWINLASATGNQEQSHVQQSQV